VGHTYGGNLAAYTTSPLQHVTNMVQPSESSAASCEKSPQKRQMH
jgi:hypothetical protein